MRNRAIGALVTLALAGGVGEEASASPPDPPAFAPYEAYSVGSSPESVVVADVNADARLDVVLSTGYFANPANDFKVFVFLQNADGTLAPPTRHDTDGAYGHPMSLAAGDLNGDLIDDVAVTTAVGVNVLHGSPDGLGLRTTLEVPFARQAVIADLDRDQRDDLVVATSEGVVAFLGNQPPTHAAPVPVTQQMQYEIEAADVTGDGLLDVVGFTGRTVHVFAFVPPAAFVPAGDHEAVVGYYPNGAGLGVGDLTGDGRSDVVLSIPGNRPGALMNIFAQRPEGGLDAPLAYPTYDIPEPVDITDTNRDGTDDIVTVHGGWNRVGVHPQVAGDIGGEFLFEIPYASHFEPKALDVGDVNGDLRPDIVVANSNYGLLVLRAAAPPPPPPPPDSTAPETTITAGPSGPISATTATFEFSSNESGSTFACRFDGGPFVPCTSPRTYSQLSDGAHYFEVRATDPAGNIDPVPAGRAFTVEGPSDLAITLTDTPDPVKSKSRLAYRLVVTNNGPSANSAATLAHNLPAQTSGVSVTTTRGTCSVSGAPAVVRCDIGAMPAGSTATVDVSVRVDAKRNTNLTSAASVTGSRTDPIAADNAASAITAVR